MKKGFKIKNSVMLTFLGVFMFCVLITLYHVKLLLFLLFDQNYDMHKTTSFFI